MCPVFIDTRKKLAGTKRRFSEEPFWLGTHDVWRPSSRRGGGTTRLMTWATLHWCKMEETTRTSCLPAFLCVWFVLNWECDVTKRIRFMERYTPKEGMKRRKSPPCFFIYMSSGEEEDWCVSFTQADSSANKMDSKVAFSNNNGLCVWLLSLEVVVVVGV